MKPEARHGPPLHAVSVFPADGAGTECPSDAPADCGVPRNTPIEVRFDRYLLPKTAVRQSLLLYTGPRGSPYRLEPTYDVVERVVTYRLGYGGRLEPGLLYHAELVLPAENPGGLGFRAFDGAPLEEGPVRLTWSFMTAEADPEPEVASVPESCAGLSVLTAGVCATCHGHADGLDPPMGLSLDSPGALEETAIDRVAHETDTGPTAGRPLVDPPSLGAGMPVLDPGDPGASYLLYKLLANPANFGDAGASCTTVHSVPLPDGTCIPPHPDEVTRLRDAFVALDPMPPNGALAGGIDDLRAIQDFILEGAVVDGCPP